MKITFKLYASLARHLPPQAERNMIELDVPAASSVHAVIDAHKIPRGSAHLALVNGIYVPPEDRDKPLLKEGDVLAVWPPVAGG